MGQLKQGTVGAPSNAKQQKRNLEGSEVGYKVRQDDTTDAEKRGECFAPSVSTRVLDSNPGFGKVKPAIEEHQTNRGWDTLSSDSRMGKAPLPEDGVKLDIHGRRRDEHVIGRSSKDVNDDNTVYGEDRFGGSVANPPVKTKASGFQVKEKNIS